MSTALLVMDLRERTDLPVMVCKAALTECGGNSEEAIELLRAAELQKRLAKFWREKIMNLLELKYIKNSSEMGGWEVWFQDNQIRLEELWLHIKPDGTIKATMLLFTTEGVTLEKDGWNNLRINGQAVDGIQSVAVPENQAMNVPSRSLLVEAEVDMTS